MWLLVCVCASAFGQDERADVRINPDVVLTEGFLAAHPDLRWRRDGLRAYDRGNYDTALGYFRRASRYGDKPSQAMVAQMYWNGTGTARDRPLAYAWMDIAAERHYRQFLLYRERYWAALDEPGRADAIMRGQALYAEYGDDVAKPRLERIMTRERRKITGSRLGFVGKLRIIPNTGPMAGSGMSLDAEQYYADKYWKPKAYWALQDEIWEAPPKGRVDVGDLEALPHRGVDGGGD